MQTRSNMANTTGKVITCKAAVAWEAKGELVVQEVQLAPPQPMEVRIKVISTSICGSDILMWSSKGSSFPRIFGHEAAGIVESVGEGVIDLEPGDHVIPVFTGECRACKFCKSPKTNYCANSYVNAFETGMKYDGTSRFSIDGKPIAMYLGSTFSEYTVVEYARVAKINPSAPLDKVCVLSCGVPTGLGAVWNVAKMEAGSVVAIFGLGTVGLAVADGAKVAGASRIIGVEKSPSKSELSKKFGVTDFINPADCEKPLPEVIKEMTDGGVDYAFECTGCEGMISTAFESCQNGWGTTVATSVLRENASILPSHLLNGRTLKGTMYGGFKTRSDLPELVERYLRKEILVDEFITEDLPFLEINKAFQLLLSGQGLRTALHF
ncbi:unnamed protein product [Sphagnum tenellum]